MNHNTIVHWTSAFEVKQRVADIIKDCMTAALAACIGSTSGWATLATSAQSLAVPINKMGLRPPLFLVTHVGGTVLCSWQLAKVLGPDQPDCALHHLEAEIAHMLVQAVLGTLDAPRGQCQANL